MQRNWRSVVVSVTFICTVLLWLLDKVTGIGANTVANVAYHCVRSYRRSDSKRPTKISTGVLSGWLQVDLL